MLLDTNISPEALEQAANSLGNRYPMAAAALRQRAAALRDQQRLEAMRRGGTPFTVRAGDIPHRLALHYTGDGNRWRELPAANAHIGMRTVTRKGVTQLEPWRGEILLPVSWEAWKKPLPPVASMRVMSAPEKKADKAISTAEKSLQKDGSK